MKNKIIVFKSYININIMLISSVNRSNFEFINKAFIFLSCNIIRIQNLNFSGIISGTGRCLYQLFYW